METVTSAIRRLTPAMLVELQSWLRIATVNPPGADYGAMTVRLMESFSALGLRMRRHRVPRAEQERLLPGTWRTHPRFNLTGLLPAGAPATLHFNAHYDVVPAGPGWRTPPFEPRIFGGWICGRGTSDMKGAIGSLWLALAALRDTGAVPAANVGVSLTADEETDSTLGAGWIVRRGLAGAGAAVVCEGGGGGAVGIGHNGVLWLEVHVQGRPAHGSRPEHGINAVEQMSRVILELARHARALRRRTYRAPDGTLLRATLNVGGVAGTGPGAKVNTVPGAASFTIDRRVLPDERVNEAERDLRAFLDGCRSRIPGLSLRVRRFNRNPPTLLDPHHPFAAAFGKAVEAVRGGPAVFRTSTGFNDTHYFAAAGLPTVGYGPEGEHCHGTGERVRVRELARAAEVYARLLLDPALPAAIGGRKRLETEG